MASKVFACAVIVFGVMSGLVDFSPGASAGGAEFVWVRQFGSSDIDEAFALAVDPSGVYVVGNTFGTLPGETSAGGPDAFLRKYDANGSVVWTRQFGSSEYDRAHDVATDSSEVYVAGDTGGILPGETGAGGADAFLRKYDANGNVVWTRQFGTAGSDLGLAVAVDSSGAYVTGFTEGIFPGETSPGARDVFVRKYDTTGNVVWTRQFGTSAEELGYDVAVNASVVYIVGFTGGEFPGETSGGDADAFVRKYDADGNAAWTRQFGTSNYDVAHAVAADMSGVYFAGFVNGTSGGGDAILRRYDAGGNIQWTRVIGTPAEDTAYDVAVNASSVYVTGVTWGTLPGETNEGDGDVFVQQYDAGGNLRWTREFGTFGFDVAYAIAPFGLYVAGFTSGVFPGEMEAGYGDAFLARLWELPEAPGVPENLQAISGDGRVSLLWQAPASTGSSPITAYRVYRDLDSASPELIAVIDPALNRYLDLEVTNGMVYHYTVSAVNEIGEGPSSAAVAATPRAPPELTISSPTGPDVTIAGATEQDVTVTIGGTPVAVSPDGSFARTVALPDGTHTFDIVATDPLRQTTSTTVTITVDTVAPALTLMSPADGTITSTPTVTVSGITEAGARLVVNGLVVDVSPAGTFSFELALREGANAISATATEPAGNAATVTRIVTYTNPVPGLEQDLEDTSAKLAAAGTFSLLTVVTISAAFGIALVVMYLTLSRKVEGQAQPRPEGEPKEPPG